MSNRTSFDFLRYRDGTSQEGRELAGLHPSFFQLDERSLEDLLIYAREHASILKYYTNKNEWLGETWTAFMEGDIPDMVAFFEDPSIFDAFPDKKASYNRPHFVLFLIFLKLLQSSQKQLNQITKRQLDFYYQSALGFVNQHAVPDKVHVLANLLNSEEQVLIPKGTLLQAGEDGQGNAIHYALDQDLLANHARIGSLMSVFVQKELTDIPLLRFKGEEDQQQEEAFLAILNMTYRKRGSANKPRDYPRNEAGDRNFGQTIIKELKDLRESIEQNLRLRIAVFQRLMIEYRKWQDQDTGRWRTINQYLLDARNRRLSRSDDLAIFSDPLDFDTNFELAMGFKALEDPPDQSHVFSGISEVETLYELFVKFERVPDELESFILDTLFFDSLDDFRDFKKQRMQILTALQNIHHVLRETASRISVASNPAWDHFQYEADRTLVKAFEELLGVTGLTDDAQLLSFENQFLDLETYFQMKAEDYYFIKDLYQNGQTDRIPEWKLQRADQLLEEAFRSFLPSARQQTIPAPKPEIIRWSNLFHARDTSQLLVTSETGDASHPRWKPFGAIPREDADPAIHAASEIGWGICSPTLALSEGTRNLSLQWTFEEKAFSAQESSIETYLGTWNAADGPFPFHVEISTEKEWVALHNWTHFAIDPDESIISLSLQASADLDAFAPLAEAPFPDPYPCLRVLLSKEALIDPNGNEAPIQVYELFHNQLLESFDLDIEVIGILDLLVQTKEGLVDPKKPFAPFGTVPAVGDRMFVSHEELCRQKLDALSLKLEWKNLPAEGLNNYYAPYAHLGNDLGVHDVQGDSFTSKLRLVEGRRSMPLSPSASSDHFALFPALNSEQDLIPHEIPNTFPDAAGYIRRAGARLDPDAEVSSGDRYLEWELDPQDFLHSKYSTLLMRQGLSGKRSFLFTETIDLAGNNATNLAITLTGIPLPEEDGSFAFSSSTTGVGINDASYNPETKELSLTKPAATRSVDITYKQALILPDPFVPELKRISANYDSSLHIRWLDKGQLPEDRIFHIEPFGRHMINPGNEKAVPFLPSMEAEGTLFIGLEGLQPPQDISFLFQLAEGSANPDLRPSRINWSYLSGNDWVAFSESQLLLDSTQGFLSSGLMRFHVPAEASVKHIRMPAGQHWIRAQVERFTDSLSEAIDIRTQAIQASWVDPGQASDHLQQALAPDSISQPIDLIPGLSGFLQPFSSFQGKVSETDAHLYRRISGRIRHKTRALTMWDYEHLVLEAFPDIYKAKALSADLAEEAHTPGLVRIIVIPDIRQRRPFDPFEPKVPVARLREIETYVTDRAPAFANIQVQNARFRYLQMRVAVRFHDMNHFGFFAGQLEQELVEYLAPWAFDAGAEIVFGGKVYPSVLVNFIETRPYVDFLDQPVLKLLDRQADGSLSVIEEPATEDGLLLIDEPDMILVSAHEHFIEFLSLPDDLIQRIRKGIGFAKIEFDFRVI